MKIKNNFFTYLIMSIIMSSCQSQSRIDLSELTLLEDFLVMIPKSERTTFYPNTIDPSSGTPSFTTNEVQKYGYKNIEFKENELGLGSVTFYTYKALEKGGDNTIAGYNLKLEYKNEELFEVLEKQYGKSQEINPIPTKRYEGILQGHHSFFWKNDKTTIILSYSYFSRNEKQNIDTTVYVLKNDAIDLTSPNRTSVERLTQTLVKK